MYTRHQFDQMLYILDRLGTQIQARVNLGGVLGTYWSTKTIFEVPQYTCRKWKDDCERTGKRDVSSRTTNGTMADPLVPAGSRQDIMAAHLATTFPPNSCRLRSLRKYIANYIILRNIYIYISIYSSVFAMYGNLPNTYQQI